MTGCEWFRYKKNVTFMLCPQICGNGGEIKVENIIISLSKKALSRSLCTTSPVLWRFCAFLKLNVVQLPKTRREWAFSRKAGFYSVQNCEDGERLTSQARGFPQALQGGGGRGHDIRSSGHRASRGDAHALNLENILVKFSLWYSSRWNKREMY